jgi:hypothetical protein
MLYGGYAMSRFWDVLSEASKWFTKDASGFFTGLQFFVVLAQAIFFWYQLKLIRVSLKDTKIAAEAAGDAAKAAARQAHVAEESLAKLERPYIFVFNASQLKVVTYEAAEGDGAFLAVTYSVANHGKIPAIIESVQVGMSVAVEPMRPPNADFDHLLWRSPILASGEERKDIEERLEWYSYGNDEYDRRVPDLGSNDLWLWVIIRYRGPFSEGHEARACLRFDSRTEYFVGFNGDKKFLATGS